MPSCRSQGISLDGRSDLTCMCAVLPPCFTLASTWRCLQVLFLRGQGYAEAWCGGSPQAWPMGEGPISWLVLQATWGPPERAGSTPPRPAVLVFHYFAGRPLYNICLRQFDGGALTKSKLQALACTLAGPSWQTMQWSVCHLSSLSWPWFYSLKQTVLSPYR